MIPLTILSKIKFGMCASTCSKMCNYRQGGAIANSKQPVTDLGGEGAESTDFPMLYFAQHYISFILHYFS